MSNEVTGSPVAAPVTAPVVEAPAKTRKPKEVEKLVVGLWNDARTVFTANAKQPPEVIEEITAMVNWARKNMPFGKYEFIKVKLGGKSLTLAKREVSSASIG